MGRNRPEESNVSRSERRREAREGSSDMKKLYLVLAAVAVIGVGAVGYSVGSGGGGAVSTPVAIEGLDDMERLVALAQGETKGDPDAAITIVEFGDYMCPHCGTFASMVKPQVEQAFVESGQARFVFYDFPVLGENAFLAARAARCAGDQDRFWEYHDDLFRNQPRWAALSNAAGTFVDYAETLGLDGGAFQSCLMSDRHAEVVSANLELGRQLGVNSTPTVLVEHGGSARWLRNVDFQAIQSVIDEILGESGDGA